MKNQNKYKQKPFRWQHPGQGFLEKGDDIAALVVAVIVIFVSGELGVRSIQALLDAAPKNGEHDRIIREVGKIKGVSDVHAVRIRSAGAAWFVDMQVMRDGKLSLTALHALTEKIERKVRSILPKSDITVHVKPKEPKGKLKKK